MQFELQQLGGRFAEDIPAAVHTAPKAPFLIHLVSPAISESLSELELATKEAFGALGPVYTGEVLYNYLRGDQQARVPSAFGKESYHRLQEIKLRYDPTNVFHLNLNIRA